jgi:hypothetical protein
MSTITPFIFAILPLVAITAPVLQNITILVPEGTSNHGDPHILCVPIHSWGIAVFFATNYIAHSATVKGLPGQPILPTILDIVFALLFPVSGLIRGLNAIFQAAVFQKTALETAVQAGAVCEIVRTTFWRPMSGDVIKDMQITRPLDVSPASGRDHSQLPATELAQEPREIVDIELDNVIPEEPVVQGQTAVGNDQDILEVEHHQVPQGRPTVVANVKYFNDIIIHEYPLFSPANGWWALTGRKVHGRCVLPDGYGLEVVPNYEKIEPLDRGVDESAAPLPVDETQGWRYMIGTIFDMVLSSHQEMLRLQRRNRLEGPEAMAKVRTGVLGKPFKAD